MARSRFIFRSSLSAREDEFNKNKPQHARPPHAKVAPGEIKKPAASGPAAAQIKLPNRNRNFRSNKSTQSRSAAPASISQKVKSFFQKIFG